MSLEAEFKREVDQAMRDDARLLAVMRSLLERARDFVWEPAPERFRAAEIAGA